ncbi:AAA family ATPase [Herpetosiphon geysericola]|uniref:Endonuclease GajA/Old nuclease/RecF-like AAA domain-containing protein n=1 Tax=Herpetosiphon geysericola TaxID=70996 RepID=A0A0P6XBW5_9CHLR|nr:AAA family ATPase [Herpetosiphon geysericola]KPL80264.1 hypothetical protein SE18_24745 [Herpetosiphon geysericola]
MSVYITQIEAYNIHDRFTIKQSFQSGLNIIYGNNGSGKTTLLHIIANILTGDLRRLKYIQFSRILIEFSNYNHIMILNNENSIDVYINSDDFIKLSKRGSNINSELINKLLFNNLLFDVGYFPAFRTMIDAWFFMNLSGNNENNNSSNSITKLARETFSNFIPNIDYVSPIEIQEKINDEIKSARLSISDIENELLVNAFYKMIDLVANKDIKSLEGKNKIIMDILRIINHDNKSVLRSSFYPEKITNKLRNISDIINSEYDEKTDTINTIILSIFRDILKDRSKKQTLFLRHIENYLSSVNEFFEDKKLEFIISSNKDGHDEYKISVTSNNKVYNNFQSLSSGERQIITLLYTATYMSSKEIILIDEPEISLHVDWQRLLLKKLMSQIKDKRPKNKQLIVCTHSPFISADHMDHMKKLEVEG